jgi:hypothetical protein
MNPFSVIITFNIKKYSLPYIFSRIYSVDVPLSVLLPKDATDELSDLFLINAVMVAPD